MYVYLYNATACKRRASIKLLFHARYKYPLASVMRIAVNQTSYSWNKDTV